MERSKTVLAEASKLYLVSKTKMGQWMWHNHTQSVADRAKKLARKYGADIEKAYCAALLHDLGDSKYERSHANFESWSLQQSEKILTKAGFVKNDQQKINEAIRTHSCRPGNLPKTLEGKILATADAMWHIQTNFFAVICYMNRPEYINTYEQWQEWFNEKIERDFGAKICFDDERAEVKESYEALKLVFGKKTTFNE